MKYLNFLDLGILTY